MSASTSAMAITTANRAKFYLKIDGLNKDLEKKIRLQLTSINPDEVTIDNRFITRIENAIRLGLKPLGYYSPIIKIYYEKIKPFSLPVLKANIDLQKPIHVENVQIILKGSAKKDKDYAKMIAEIIPQKGMILNHKNYENLKQEFSRLAFRKGYFDAEMEHSQLGVSLAHNTAYWSFYFNSGERYRFGKIIYEGSQICEDYLNNLLTFKNGDYYTTEQLAEFNQRLIDTGWFNSAIVTPNLNQAREHNQNNSESSYILPINVALTPRSRNNIELGIGYSNEVGPRVKVIWNKPWTNSRGQSFASNISLSHHEKLVDASYKIPIKDSPLEQYYTIQTGYKLTKLNGIKSNITSLNLLKTWDHQNKSKGKGWQYSVNLRCSFNNFVQQNLNLKNNSTMLIYPGISIRRIQQRGKAIPIPYLGDSQHYTINMSHINLGSDINFIVAQAQNRWIITPYKRHRVIITGNFGWIKTNKFDKVPLELRFFTGGNCTIRGYNYQNHSLINNSNNTNTSIKLAGFSKLAISSLEYQYNLVGNWWGAIFIDCGEAVHVFNKKDLKVGAGTGIRLISPIGPINVDIATPFFDPNYSKTQFYIRFSAEL